MKSFRIFCLTLLISTPALSQTKLELSKLYDKAYENCMSMTGDTVFGIKQATQFIQSDSSYPNIYNTRGVAYMRCKQYKEALADFQKAATLDKGFYIAYYNSGLTCCNMEEYEKAKPFFQKALQIQPSHVRSNYFLADCYGKTGEPEKAISYYNKALSFDDRHYKSYKDRGITYIQLKKYESALSDFESASAINSKDPELNLAKANAYIHLEQADKAIKELDKAKKRMDDPLLDFLYGLAYAVKKDNTQACLYFGKAAVKGFSEAQEAMKEYCK